MAVKTEDIDATLPSGERITATIPAGLSDTQAKAYMQGKRPDLFPATGMEKQIQQEAQPWNNIGASLRPGNIAKNVYQGGKSAVQGAAALGKDLYSNPNWFTGQNSTLNKFVFQPADVEAAKAKQNWGQGRYSEALGHGLASAIPFAGPWAAGLGEQAATGDVGGAIGQAVGPSALAGVAGAALGNVGLLRPQLKAITHDLLNKAAETSQKKLRDVHANVSAHTGALKADLSNADYADGGDKIVATDLHPKIDEVIQNYKPALTPLSKFDSAVKMLANVDSPTLSFEQAADLRTAVGSLGAKALEGTRDAAAMGELYKALTEKLSNRANELGQAKKFGDYNGIWKTMMEYERDSGPLGKMLGALDGQSFFKHLNDLSGTQELKRINDSLTNYGLDKDYFNSLRKDHSPAYNYVTAPTTIRGKMGNIARHPVAGVGGAIAGATAGSVVPGVGHWLGAIGGSALMANLVDRARASRYVSEQGGPLSTAGEMKQYTSQPSGVGVQRPAAPANPQMLSQLTKDMQSLGYDKTEAARRATLGVTAYPDDLQKATDAAIRGDQPPKSVSGGSQSAPASKAPAEEPGEQYTSGFARKAKQIQKIKSVSGGSQENWEMPSPTEDLVKAVRQAMEQGTNKDYFAKQLTRYMYPSNASKITPELVDKAWALEQAVRKAKKFKDEE